MINKIILMGRLTADPELRQTQNGISVVKFTVAVNRQFADKQTGERQADFINVTAWRTTADFVAKYFHKGSMIIVEGSLRNNNYTDQNGVKHYSMIVQADSVNFGESKSAAGGGQPQQNYAPPANTYPQTAPPQTAQNGSYKAKQTTLDNFNTNYNMGDLSDFEVLSDEATPF